MRRATVTLLNGYEDSMKKTSKKSARKGSKKSGKKRVSFYARRNGPEGGWGKGLGRWAAAAIAGVVVATGLTLGLAYTDLGDGAQDGILAGAGLLLGGAALAFGAERLAPALWAGPTSVAAVRAVVRMAAESQTASIREAAVRAIGVSAPANVTVTGAAPAAAGYVNGYGGTPYNTLPYPAGFAASGFAASPVYTGSPNQFATVS